MTRKLASVQRIKELLPIKGADRIELAIINGWQAIVKKGEFNVGDQIVYIEIDAWVPNAVAPFLTEADKEPKEFNGVKGERLKSKKLKKVLSQGLILSMAALGSKEIGYTDGTDVSEALGIQLWESPAEHKEKNGTNQQASKTRSFPYFLRKTDQERIQNYGHMVERALDEEFEVTVKKDGSSLTVFRVNPASAYYADAKELVHGKPGLFQRIKEFFTRPAPQPVFGICSRNVLLPLDGDSNFHKAAAPLLAKMKGMNGGSIALQAELVAPDIQGNYEKVEGIETHLFDIFDIDRQAYFLPAFRRDFAALHGIRHATIVDRGTPRSILQLKDGDDVVKKALTYASGQSDNPAVMREGVVFKAEGRDFSFKAISNEYLLAKED